MPILPASTTTPSASSSPTSAASLAIARMAGILKVASALAAAGRRIDLAGFESEAGRLCAAVFDLPLAEARTLTAPLTALLGEVDALAARLAHPGAEPAD